MVKSVIVGGESGVGGVPYRGCCINAIGGVGSQGDPPKGHHRPKGRATGPKGMPPQGHHRATTGQGMGHRATTGPPQGRAWHRARAMAQPSDGPLAGTTGSVRGTDVFFSINDI